MRCPKCGYISFDHLTACSNCSRDLTALAEELRGTSVETDLSLFLGQVVGEEPSGTEPRFDAQPEAGATTDLALADEDSETAEIMLQLDESPASAGPAESMQVPELAAAPELTLDMDELPAFDLSQIEEEAGPTTEPAEQTEMLLAEARDFQEGQNEQLTLNLDEIDLSDLAPLDEEQTAPEAEPPPEPEPELTFDLGAEAEAEAALDLGSMEDESETPILDLEDFMLGTGLERPEESPEADELQAMLSNKAAKDGQPAKAEPSINELELDLDFDMSLDFPDATKDKPAPSPPELKLTLENEDDKS